MSQFIDDEDTDLVAGFKWYPIRADGKVYVAGWKHVPPGAFSCIRIG